VSPLAGNCRQRSEHILDLEKNQPRLPPRDPEKRSKQPLARITQQPQFELAAGFAGKTGIEHDGGCIAGEHAIVFAGSLVIFRSGKTVNVLKYFNVVVLAEDAE